jgi:sterile alpha motif and leucine zipper-containing kinase AZK
MSSAESRESSSTKLTSYPRIPRNDLVVQDQLGCGSFGSVYRGIWRCDGKEQVVALKKVFMLEKEVDILSQIRHRNIIHFYGVSQANPDFYIVTEYAEHGCLYEYLHNDSAELPFDLILQWALQIAHGVHYLHFEAPATIIHRDLKSKNVVLSKGYGDQIICKLCDFGTSKDLTHSFTRPTWAGTAAWMSPEIITQKEGITTATDVWSYAVVLWELVSREVPYKGLTEFKIYSIISQHGERLVIPETCPLKLANLLKNCWYTEPRDRIDMKMIILELQKMEANAELHLECTNFVKQKGAWRGEIDKQLKALNELKIDLARQKEELEKREQALTRRETTHQSFLHLQEFFTFNDVSTLTEDEICQWLRLLADTAPEEPDPDVVEGLITYIEKFKIDGSRILNVTEKDLQQLGIQKGTFCDYLLSHIEELQSRYAFETMPLRMSSIAEQRNKNDKSKQPFDFPLVLHIGLYQREMCSTTCSTRYRFKVFVDSDWQQCTMTEDMPSEIYDSATVIKDVCISLVDSNKRVLLETVRCLCPPFGYLEWINAPQDGGSVSVTITVTYTDQVMRPRNTCINAEITDFSCAQTVHNRVVMLKLRPIPTNTSISRINSALFNNSIQSPTPTNNNINSIQSVWRRRRSSFGTDGLNPIERARNIALLKIRGANAGIRGHEIQHSLSVTDDSQDDQAYFRPRSISHYIPSPGSTTASSMHAAVAATAGTSAINHNPSPSPKPMIRPKAYSNPFAQFRRSRKNSELSSEANSSTSDSKHFASFFLDSSSSPPVIHEHHSIPPVKRTSPSPSPTSTLKFEEEENEPNEIEQCCKNDCRHRKAIIPPKEIQNIDEVEPLKIEKKKCAVF